MEYLYLPLPLVRPWVYEDLETLYEWCRSVGEQRESGTRLRTIRVRL